MTANEILEELKSLGTEQTRKTFRRHGAPETMYGVKVQDLKTIVKRVKKNQALALELYETGISDAMYLAALICEPEKFTKPQLNKWAKQASWHMISEYTVAWAAAESRFAIELATSWIDAKQPNIQASGWSTLTYYIAMVDDSELDMELLQEYMNRVPNEVESAANRVRYTMNGYIIGVGCYVKALNPKAKTIAKKLGKVEVDVGDTSCKVPNALEYILKVEKMGRLGKKRKTAMC